jgi:hypothetical protein
MLQGLKMPIMQEQHSFWKIGVSFILFLTVGFLIIYYKNDVLTLFQGLSHGWVALGVVLYLVNYIMRSLRILLLSDNELRLWPDGFYATCLHGFTTYMLPLRSGELALPVILHKITRMQLIEGSQILVRARLLDMMTIGFWVLTVLILFEIDIPPLIILTWYAVGILLLLAPPLVVRIGDRMQKFRVTFLQKIGRITGGRAFQWHELAISFSIWLTVAGSFFCVLKAIGLPLSFVQIWLLITIQLPLQLIPLQGIANTGNHEGAWVTGLVLLGVTPERALSVALVSHAIFFAYVILLGGIAAVMSLFCGKATKTAESSDNK